MTYVRGYIRELCEIIVVTYMRGCTRDLGERL